MCDLSCIIVASWVLIAAHGVCIYLYIIEVLVKFSYLCCHTKHASY